MATSEVEASTTDPTANVLRTLDAVIAERDALEVALSACQERLTRATNLLDDLLAGQDAPVFHIRAGARSAAVWDNSREKEVRPVVHQRRGALPPRLSWPWMDTAPGGETQRVMDLPLAEVPALIRWLENILIEAGRQEVE